MKKLLVTAAFSLLSTAAMAQFGDPYLQQQQQQNFEQWQQMQQQQQQWLEQQRQQQQWMLEQQRLQQLQQQMQRGRR
jgi:hypothetical protein